MGMEHNYYTDGCWCGDIHVVSEKLEELKRQVAEEERAILNHPSAETISSVTDDAVYVSQPQFTTLISEELSRVDKMYPPMTSVEEAYAVIKEEFEEFWDEVKVKDHQRDWGNMATELVQTAAMCMRAYNDVVSKKIQELEEQEQEHLEAPISLGYFYENDTHRRIYIFFEKAHQ